MSTWKHNHTFHQVSALQGLLEEWYKWGQQQPDLCQQAKMLCFGPCQTAEVFDRSTIQGVPFSTTKTKGKKRSRGSVVLVQDNNKFWAGRVPFFLSHTPAGVGVAADLTTTCALV